MMDAQEQVFLAICRYIDSELSNYAILIDGEWGSGKTFFWRNKIVPHLNLNKKKYLYVSLYGLTSIDDIDRRLLIAQFPILKNGMMEAFTKLSKSGLDHFGIKLPMKSLKADTANSLLCFDDLERMSPSINVSDALGYINSFVEHDGRKVILISNEKEIKDGQYSRVKEKLIWKTYKYEPVLEDVMSSMISGLEGDYAHFVLSAKTDLIRTVTASKTVNLRALSIAINDFAQIFKHFSRTFKSTIPNSQKLLESILNMYLAMILEFKEDEKNTTSLKHLFGEEYFSLLLRFSEKEGETTDYLEGFLSRYFDGKLSDLQRLRSIYKCAVEGFFDSDLFDEEIRKYTSSADVPDADQKLYFGEYWKLSDEQFRLETEKAFRKIEDLKIKDLVEMTKIAHRLFFYTGDGLIPQSSAALRTLLVKAIEESQKQGILQYSDVNGAAPSEFYELDNDDYHAVQLVIAEVDKELYKTQTRATVEKIYGLMKANFSDGLKEFDKTENQYLMNEPVFAYIDPHDLSALLVTQTNESATSFYSFLRQRYRPHGLTKLAPEKNNLSTLLADIESQYEQLKGTVAGSIRKSLIAVLKDAISKI